MHMKSWIYWHIQINTQQNLYTLSSPVNKSISLKALPITSVPHQKEHSLTIMIPLFQPTISVPILQFGQLNQYIATISCIT